MKIDFRGIEKTNSKIKPLIDFLKNSNDYHIWEYMGLKVTIDPTVDCKNENILIRWLDIDEGFNDKKIVYSLSEFQSQFKSVVK
ncbi:hypothetical protein [Flavobacterium commune]|uniref:Uncharacterized protein n=1 Tax=Flavobacterium commune TaxID=1306519 RepID=A0A1D9PCC8_9FLAO|nr:hypothetical protein [Flavobacterium commune]APA00212.1 hypothetical protein BIW12_12675 [Flavobacterium commune]